MLVIVAVGVGGGVLVAVGVLVGDNVGVGDGVGVGESVGVDVGVLVGVEVGIAVAVGVLVSVAVAVGTDVLVGDEVGAGVGLGVLVGDGVGVGESVGVDAGVLVGAGVKVGIGALIGDGVLSAPQKQPEANATGSVRNAMRITYGRGFIASPRLIQGIDRHDVERMRRTVSRTSAMRCMSCLHIESPDEEAITGSRLGNGITFARTPTQSCPGAAYCCGICSTSSTGFGAHG